jgi:integrase
MLVEVQELARQHTTDAVETLVSIMRSPKVAAAARVSAANALLDRGYGKAPQHQHITGEGGPQFGEHMPNVCATIESELIRPNSLTRSWHRACLAAGLETISFHSLRHYRASTLIKAGVDVLTVSRRLGPRQGGHYFGRLFTPATWLRCSGSEGDRGSAKVAAVAIGLQIHNLLPQATELTN